MISSQSDQILCRDPRPSLKTSFILHRRNCAEAHPPTFLRYPFTVPIRFFSRTRSIDRSTGGGGELTTLLPLYMKFLIVCTSTDLEIRTRSSTMSINLCFS
ncbi:hypothetical protein Mp_1g05810 [Marchantia polymorpha subsp. ruderalis]|uniref:Uncharacterized protein n=2 Tax=Marchantia polymorpha TaxID=3197 RepID=A0AAF6ALX9_MARPO|nr:hypothetical protein MARPO_0005s0027 [Marchantia polymorpha]BBM97449.1 hypothetical protein Mp_1g05810 [Marchantia polymorpha subsp. ruderalis]|eukprot:PTQ48355.1 hypothetical protein MARPO_0005s0027 [Marchantia polymorpha]